jgi:hypothetical protein
MTHATPTERPGAGYHRDDIAGHKVGFIVATASGLRPKKSMQIFSENIQQKYKDCIRCTTRSDEMVPGHQTAPEMRVNKQGVDAHKIVIISSSSLAILPATGGANPSFRDRLL